MSNQIQFDPESKIKSHFDQFSKIYKENYYQHKSGNNFEFRNRLKVVSELTTNYFGCLLDCACGTGEITAKVLTPGAFSAATLVDLSNEMLMIAKQNIDAVSNTTAITYEQTSIFDYKPGPELKFDVILCLGLIAHTGQLMPLLLQLKPMLKPEGKIILQSSLLDHIGVKLQKLLMPVVIKKRNLYEHHFYRLSEINTHVSSAGMKIESCIRYNFGFPFGDKISKGLNYRLEVLMRRFSMRFGSEAIFVISNSD